MPQGRLLLRSTRALPCSGTLFSLTSRHFVCAWKSSSLQLPNDINKQRPQGRAFSSMSTNNQPPQPPPFIARFYGNEAARDDEGRNLDEILNFDDYELEGHHDYIQVIFPLPERSPINPSAPKITKEVRDAFRRDELLRDNLFRAFARMASFYAFDVSGTPADPTLTPKTNFEKLARETWRTRMDHNHLRITRIIRCMRILGLEKAASDFYEALCANEGGKVASRSLMYWERAAKRPLHLPPDESNEEAPGVGWLRGYCAS
ncbi:Opioid growth factor receptor [Cercospora zeina]